MCNDKFINKELFIGSKHNSRNMRAGKGAKTLNDNRTKNIRSNIEKGIITEYHYENLPNNQFLNDKLNMRKIMNAKS